METGVASRPRVKNLSRNLLHFSSCLPSTPTYPGDIKVFKGMALKKLDLYGCKLLIGK